MASKSSLTFLEDGVRNQVDAILARSSFLAADTEPSDRMRDLLRELSAALVEFDTRSIDIRNQAAALRG